MADEMMNMEGEETPMMQEDDNRTDKKSKKSKRSKRDEELEENMGVTCCCCACCACENREYHVCCCKMSCFTILCILIPLALILIIVMCWILI